MNLMCERCGKTFNHRGNYKRHINRKTSCALIKRDPTQPISNPNTCKFCGSEYTAKRSLLRHYQTCKIKNGNMGVLFKKIELLTEENRKMENKMKKLQEENKKLRESRINIGTQNINITINNLINFGSLEMEDRIEDLLREKAKKILYEPKKYREEEEIKNRISKLVSHIYRNPEAPELQNIYTQNAKEHLLNIENPNPIRAFFWNEQKWNLGEWGKMGRYLAGSIFNGLPEDLKNKLDVLHIRKKICNTYKADPLRSKPKKLINNYLHKYKETRDEADSILLYFALVLDEETIRQIKN